MQGENITDTFWNLFPHCMLLYTLLPHTGSTHLVRFDLSLWGARRSQNLLLCPISLWFWPNSKPMFLHRWSPCILRSCCLNKIKIIGTLCNIGPSIISHASIRRTSSAVACCSNDEKKIFQESSSQPSIKNETPKIRQSTIWYAGSLGRLDKQLGDQVSEVPSIFFLIIFLKT